LNQRERRLQLLSGRKQRKIPIGSINRVDHDSWRPCPKICTHGRARSTGLVDPAVSSSGQGVDHGLLNKSSTKAVSCVQTPPSPPSRTRKFSSPLMKFTVLVSAFLLPVVSLAHDPSPLLADDGRDLSFLLKRYDGPIPILRRAVKGKRHTVPRTLQVEEVPVRRALNGLVERQQCTDAGYVPCPGGVQCCPAGSVCGPTSCCPAGNLACTGNCKDHRSSLFRLSLPLTRCRSSGCPDVLGDCCPSVGCCPTGQVSPALY